MSFLIFNGATATKLDTVQLGSVCCAQVFVPAYKACGTYEVAIAASKFGILTLLHVDYSVDDLYNIFFSPGVLAAPTFGLNDTDMRKCDVLLGKLPKGNVSVVHIQSASINSHGALERVADLVERHSDVNWIVSNVLTYETMDGLARLGVAMVVLGPGFAGNEFLASNGIECRVAPTGSVSCARANGRFDYAKFWSAIECGYTMVSLEDYLFGASDISCRVSTDDDVFFNNVTINLNNFVGFDKKVEYMQSRQSSAEDMFRTLCEQLAWRKALVTRSKQ